MAGLLLFSVLSIRMILIFSLILQIVVRMTSTFLKLQPKKTLNPEKEIPLLQLHRLLLQLARVQGEEQHRRQHSIQYSPS
jgi:hypothetical protein